MSISGPPGGYFDPNDRVQVRSARTTVAPTVNVSPTILVCLQLVGMIDADVRDGPVELVWETVSGQVHFVSAVFLLPYRVDKLTVEHTRAV